MEIVSNLIKNLFIWKNTFFKIIQNKLHYKIAIYFQLRVKVIYVQTLNFCLIFKIT